MPTLDDIAQDGATETVTDIPQVQEQPTPIQNNRLQELLNKLLTAETGEGEVEEYLSHPMNFYKSKGLAQILRGVHGLGANLKLAIIDIGLGFLRFSKERKGVNNNDVSSGGGFPS